MTNADRQRKLSTIVAMDVVNYTAKMGADEVGTLEQLATRREIIKTIVVRYQGRIFNTAGDAFMIEFASPVSAVSASIAIQKQISLENRNSNPEHRMEFRVLIWGILLLREIICSARE